MRYTKIFEMQIFKKKPLKRSNHGYVAILVCLFTPIALLGVKFALDLTTKYHVDLHQSSGKYHKVCAREAAIAVARNYNPGLNLSQQKDALLKIADTIYNSYPCFNDSVNGSAIPGLLVKRNYSIQSNSVFSPLIAKARNIMFPRRVVSYSNTRKYENIYRIDKSRIWNPHFAMWRFIDKGTDPVNRVSAFDEVDQDELKKGNLILKHHDIYTAPYVESIGNICREHNGIYYPNNDYYVPNELSKLTKIYCNIPELSNSSTYNPNNVFPGTSTMTLSLVSDYLQRIRPASVDWVDISINNDSIKVRTDGDEAHALPANCNVDIVIAVPTNGAASNIHNLDGATNPPDSSSEVSVSGTLPTAITSTPIYEIGQTLRGFVKNFYHTRGVNMGLIPYSGKVSISPDKASEYTTFIFPFMIALYQKPFTYNIKHDRIMMGILYGTLGKKDAPLGTIPISIPYPWNNELTGCPIMCRNGQSNFMTDLGSNMLFRGDPLSNDSTSNTNLKFRQMNLNPCYAGYANLLSLKCEKTCTTFLPNPYYMLELTADLIKIYELCNALYPFYDKHNISNFIFIPVTWANNMFQAWTDDPGCVATSDRLSRPSKTTSGRKKALILIVNKPDWFEPGELTYLGFDNDNSIIPMSESDKIDFAIDYSDTSKRYLDGSYYNTNHTADDANKGINNVGLIAGPKKIIKFTTYSGTAPVRRDGYYELDKGIYRLSFPERRLIKLVVAPSSVPMDDRGEGAIKIHSNTLMSLLNTSHYDFRADSANGRVLSLNTRIPFSGTKKFVFPFTYTSEVLGYGLPSSEYCSSIGPNFQHNLTYYKVKYELENAEIVNCVLRKQVLRYYGGMYTNNKIRRKKPLILNDITFDFRNDYYRYYSGEEMINDPYPEYKDTCMELCDKYGYEGGPVEYYTGDYTPPFIRKYMVKVYGVSSGTWILFGAYDDIIKYYRDNNYYTDPRGPYQIFDGSDNTRACYALLLENKEDKPFIKNISDDDLRYNRGVGLKSLSSGIGFIYAGDYICFQGDGELEIEVKVNPTDSTLQFHNVSGNNAEHIFKDRQTFYITPDQMSDAKDSEGNYYVEFRAEYMKLISAEITNRPYKTIKPFCTIQGPTNTLNSSGTVQILTNVKEEMQIKVRTQESYITFYNDNRGSTEHTGVRYTNYTDTRHFWFVERSYSIDQFGNYTGSANFGNNYSIYKVKYSAHNAKITDAYLRNQVIRYNSNGMDSAFVLWCSGKPQTSYFSGYDDSFSIIIMGIIAGYVSYNITNEGSPKPAFYNVTFPTKSRNPGRTSQGIAFPNSSYSLWNEGTYRMEFYGVQRNLCGGLSGDALNNLGFQLVTPPSYFYLNSFYVENLRTQVDWGGYNRPDSDIHDNLCVTADGSWIKFNGDGKLTVSVISTVNTTGYVKYKNASEENMSIALRYGYDIISYKTIKIDPAKFKYESNADGSLYSIRLDLENVQIDTSYGNNGVAFSNIDPNKTVYQFEELETSKFYRKIEYRSGIYYDQRLIYGRFNTFYNPLLGYRGISLEKGYGGIENIRPIRLPSDITHIMEDYGSKPAWLDFDIGGKGFNGIFMPGCTRIFAPIPRGSPGLIVQDKTTTGGAISMLLTAFTYPENVVLKSRGYHDAGHPDISLLASNVAVSALTQDACVKLKNDLGANLRVYLIKYRQQTASITPTGEPYIPSYSYLDVCASGSPYIYNVSTKADLKTTLDRISADIKAFAGYEEAKNLD